jgi:hypothetical protein
MLVPSTNYHVYGGSRMDLTIPPEPTMLKKQSKQQKTTREWDIDSLVMWFGNRLPTYLWNDAGWSKPLKEEGYNWQSFLKILSLHKKDIICWSHDAITWKDFLQKLQDTITNPVLKALLLQRDTQGARLDD